MKKILRIQRAPTPHWVGNGFHVNSLFFYGQDAEAFSPFLMLDYGAPRTFAPSSEPRGVGQHPHRGFETVTVAYQGEIEHHDSEGNRGIIGPGDVQWMTAASGIIHEEWLSPEFNARGGTLEMAQLWVNLPARDKMAPPAYQGILKSQIPSVVATGGARVQVIAGEFAGSADGAVTSGPARTFSPVNVWDVQLAAGQVIDLDLHAGYTTLFAVLKGKVNVNATQEASSPSLVVLDREGTAARLEAIGGDATVLVLHGEPLNEPVAGYGPFVMNTREEIMQAMQDFQRGTFIRQKVASA
ncbi:MAG TPA: pirin family protein [Casimicrobium huifangae]|uniref:pirin family protein n=1 Tax=Casimicrobium huifangae TaxID=2591109 RepID=UPI0012ECA204|nr:pirin family protein [Casimicrobium huifangae]HOB01148.1 pirin family protein [Casimicrobium huifangae]HQA34360.1 pirin family protein [Casimicrobium huifangae]HQD66198.1 pirin family protein [Casimicrobium huifangae]